MARGSTARTGARNEQATTEFAERLAGLLIAAGTPRMPARVLSALMCSVEGVMTVAELTDQLHVSPAAVSSAVRYLAQVGLAQREHVPGSRRDRYRVSDTPWYEAFASRDRFLRNFAQAADEGIEIVGGPASDSGRRLGDLRDFFSFLQAESAASMARWHSQHRS